MTPKYIRYSNILYEMYSHTGNREKYGQMKWQPPQQQQQQRQKMRIQTREAGRFSDAVQFQCYFVNIRQQSYKDDTKAYRFSRSAKANCFSFYSMFFFLFILSPSHLRFAPYAFYAQIGANYFMFVPQCTQNHNSYMENEMQQ